MSESILSQSVSENGTTDVETQNQDLVPHHKREADSETHDLKAKKLRTEAQTAPDASGCEEARKPEAVLDEQNTKEVVFDIEADAAEDKGSRHTMEDAWLVLLDASLDYPGKLRFLSLSVFFVIVMTGIISRTSSQLLQLPNFHCLINLKNG